MSIHAVLIVAASVAAPLASGAPLAVGAQAARTTVVVRADSPEGALAQVLRDSRLKGEQAQAPDLLRTRLSELGESGVAPALRVLLTRSIPSLDPQLEPQVLSEPQTLMLAAALESWPSALALELMEQELALGANRARAWAALHVWSAAGGPEHLERGLALVASVLPRNSSAREFERPLELSVERLLRRRPDSFEPLTRAYLTVDPRLRLALLLGVGATGDARASGLFALVLEQDPEHAPAALAQTQIIGRCYDAEAHAALCDQLRLRLDSPKSHERSAALRALGAQGDWRSVVDMLDRLEDEDRGVSASALWALERATRLSWRDPRAWRTWYDAELVWRRDRLDFVLETLQSSAPRQAIAGIEEAAKHPLFALELAPWVADTLRSYDGDARAAAAETLGRLLAPVALPALLDALGDDDPKVVSAVHRALTAISGLTVAEADSALWRSALWL